jgi:hypothetical protein
MPHIFISYAREDTASAKALADLLASEGFDVWWDPHLRVGQDFPDEIEKAIWDSHHVIVLWTRHSVQSEWVRSESGRAHKLRKLLPIQLEDCEVPRGFQTLHTIRFDGWSNILPELYRTIGGGGFAMPSTAVHQAMARVILPGELNNPRKRPEKRQRDARNVIAG